MRSIRSLVLIWFGLWMAICPTAFGHGFQLSLSGNKLVGTSDDFLDMLGTNPSQVARALNASYIQTSGAVALMDGGGLSLANGDTFSLEFFTPLVYSSGGAAVPASGVTMTVNSHENTPRTAMNLIDTLSLTGSTGFPDLLTASATTSHSAQWQLAGGTIPAGVYGFAYKAHGVSGTTMQPFDSSDPLVVLFNTSDFTDVTVGAATVLAAQAAVYSIVPEPGAMTLAGIGAAFGAVTLLRRRRRRVGTV